MQKLTKAEEEIMQIVWELGEVTVGDIRDYVSEKLGQKKPAPSTVSTMMRILEEKGFLKHRTYGRAFVYEAVVSKEQYSSRSLRKLLADYFGGSPNRLISFLVKDQDMSLEELNELIDKLEKNKDQ
jgi:predicted transcriptional regulator